MNFNKHLFNAGPTAPQDPGQPTTGVPGSRSAPFAAFELGTRGKDTAGNAVPRTYVYGPALPSDTPLGETSYKATLDILREFDPVAASQLNARWETEVRQALQTCGKLREEEERKREAHNVRAAAANETLETEIGKMEAQEPEELAVLKEELEAQSKRVHQAHQEAGEAVVLAQGGEYDPGNPSEDCALQVRRRDLRAIAAEMGLPYEGTKPSPGYKALMNGIATIALGLFFGYSFGMLMHVLRPQTLSRTPLLLLVCCLFGIVWSYVTRLIIMRAAEHLAQRFYSGQKWIRSLVFAVLVCLSIVVIDGLAGTAGVQGLSGGRERGLLANYRTRERDDETRRGMLLTLCVTVPYTLYAFSEGFRRGSTAPIEARLTARQEHDFRAGMADRRGRPEVQAALVSIARARDAIRQENGLKQRSASILETWRMRIEEKRGRLTPLQETLSPEAVGRIDSAVHEARCRLHDWTTDLNRAIEGSHRAVR